MQAQVASKSRWHSDELCRRMSQALGRHFLGLSVRWMDDDGPKAGVASGFLLVYQEYWFWVTAGHVIRELSKWCDRISEYRVTAHWSDCCKIEGAQSVPISDFANLAYWFVDEEGLDLGAVLIRPFEAQAIQANPNIEPLTEKVWRGRENACPNSYYIVGSPNEWQAVEVIERENSVYVDFSFPIVAIPLDRVQSPVDSDDSFWMNPDAFYGRIAGGITNDGAPLRSIKGVSGGPVFGVELSPENKLVYWLFGIQSAWKPRDQFIRATEVSFLEDALSRLPLTVSRSNQVHGDGA